MTTLSISNNHLNSTSEKATADFKSFKVDPQPLLSESDDNIDEKSILSEPIDDNKLPFNMSNQAHDCIAENHDSSMTREDNYSPLDSSSKSEDNMSNTKLEASCDKEKSQMRNYNPNLLFDIMSMTLANNNGLDGQSLLASALKNCTQLQLNQILTNTASNGQTKTLRGVDSLLENYQLVQNSMNPSSGNSTCSPTGTSSTKSCCTSPLSSNGNSSSKNILVSQQSRLQKSEEIFDTSFNLNENDKSPQINTSFPQMNQIPDTANSQYSISPAASSTDGKRCSFCNKTFTCASALRIHFRKHSGERPYKCKFCSKAFSQNGTLKRHYQTCKSAPHNRGGNMSRVMDTDYASNKSDTSTTNPTNVMNQHAKSCQPPPAPPTQLIGLFDSEKKSAANMDQSKMNRNLNNLFTNPLLSQEHLNLLTKASEMFKNNFGINQPNQLQSAPSLPMTPTSQTQHPSFKFPASNIPLNSQPANQPNFISNIAASLMGQMPNTPSDAMSLLSMGLLPGLMANDTANMAMNKRKNDGNNNNNDSNKLLKRDTDHDLKQLIKNLKNNTPLFHCDQCNIFFVDRDSFSVHSKFHLSEGPSFACSLCTEVMSGPADFLNHFLLKHNSQN